MFSDGFHTQTLTIEYLTLALKPRALVEPRSWICCCSYSKNAIIILIFVESIHRRWLAGSLARRFGVE
jgi:hypothetical protein